MACQLPLQSLGEQPSEAAVLCPLSYAESCVLIPLSQSITFTFSPLLVTQVAVGVVVRCGCVWRSVTPVALFVSILSNPLHKSSRTFSYSDQVSFRVLHMWDHWPLTRPLASRHLLRLLLPSVFECPRSHLFTRGQILIQLFHLLDLNLSLLFLQS